MIDNEHILTLIAKKLQGQANATEIQELSLWLNADANHQLAFDELTAIWQRSGSVLTHTHFDVDAAWQKVDQAITGIAPKQPARIITLFHNSKRAIISIAAIGILSIGTYWWYTQSQWQRVIALAANRVVNLPDHSEVLLRKGSTLYFPKHFDAKERRVRLSGEAFFKVQHNEHQPFNVSTERSAIQELGTSFLVNASAAHDEIVVVTGKVNVSDRQKSGNQVVLTAGQRVLLQDDHFYENTVTDSNFIAWETGSLSFKDASLQKVLDDLGHYYGAPLEIGPGQETATANLRITVQFENQPLSQALDELKLITGLETKKEKDKIIFYRK